MNKMNKNNKKKATNTEKKGDLLIQVDDLMNQLENDYGPLMLEELKKRLNKTIEEFQHDVESVLKNAFENHKLKYENSVSDLSETEDEVPSYISDYENKKKNNKK